MAHCREALLVPLLPCINGGLTICIYIYLALALTGPSRSPNNRTQLSTRDSLLAWYTPLCKHLEGTLLRTRLAAGHCRQHAWVSLNHGSRSKPCQRNLTMSSAAVCEQDQMLPRWRRRAQRGQAKCLQQELQHLSLLRQ